MSTCTTSQRNVEIDYYPGPAHFPHKIRGVLCQDGKSRTATCSPNGPDTFFSIPARVSAYGRTVSGFVSTDDGVWRFIAYKYGRNGAVFSRAIEQQEADERRLNPPCGRCGGSAYITDPPGSDLSVEGVKVEPCPACEKERTMHGTKFASEQVRATMLSYFDRLVAEGMNRADAYIRIGERFAVRSNWVMKLVQERDEFNEQRKKMVA